MAREFNARRFLVPAATCPGLLVPGVPVALARKDEPVEDTVAHARVRRDGLPDRWMVPVGDDRLVVLDERELFVPVYRLTGRVRCAMFLVQQLKKRKLLERADVGALGPTWYESTGRYDTPSFQLIGENWSVDFTGSFEKDRAPRPYVYPVPALRDLGWDRKATLPDGCCEALALALKLATEAMGVGGC